MVVVSKPDLIIYICTIGIDRQKNEIQQLKFGELDKSKISKVAVSGLYRKMEWVNLWLEKWWSKESFSFRGSEIIFEGDGTIKARLHLSRNRIECCLRGFKLA